MTTTPVTLDGCQIAPSVTIEAPECERPRFGLYSVTTPVLARGHLQNGVQWIPEQCTPNVEAYCNRCTTPGDPKTFHRQPDLRVALPFAVYGSHTCSGITAAQAQVKASANLTAGEEWRVEREFLASLRTPDTVDLTPAGPPISLVRGLVELETWAGTNTLCRPTLHLPRGVPVAAPFGSLFVVDTRMRTALGSDVVPGPGYENIAPDGTPAAPGEFWLYVTGPVHVWRGEIVKAANTDTSNNDVSAFAERAVLTGFECGAAAIKVVIG